MQFTNNNHNPYNYRIRDVLEWYSVGLNFTPNKMSQVLWGSLDRGEEIPPVHWRINQSCSTPSLQVISVYVYLPKEGHVDISIFH